MWARRARYSSLVVSVVLGALASRATSGEVLASHVGSSDPTTEGWRFELSQLDPHNPPFVGPVVNDTGSGIHAWRIDTLSNGLGVDSLSDEELYLFDLDPADASRAMEWGWRLTGKVKMAGGKGVSLGFYAQETVYAVYLEVDGGDLLLNTAEDAPSTFRAANRAGQYELIGLQDVNADGSSEVTVGGVEVLSGYSGLSANVYRNLTLFGDTVGLTGGDYEGDASFAEVRFEILSRLHGDANLDGSVDDNDLSLLLANWTGVGGEGKNWGQGDFDGNGAVSDADLSLLLTNWTGSGAVPEPATLSLLVAGAVVVVRHRPRP